MSGSRHAGAPRRRLPGPGRVAAFALTLVLLVLVVAPVVFVALGSLMPEREYRQIPRQLVPRTWTLENYGAVLAEGSLVRAMLNSTVIAILEVGAILITSSLAGYVFARKRFRGKDFLFLFVLASAMVPFTALLIPLYLTFTDLGLDDNYVGVVLPTAMSAFGIFMCRQFIRAIPQDLFDAAVMDGASDLHIYRRVVLPLIRAQLAALGIFALEASVNALLWPLVIISDRDLSTLAMTLLRYAQTGLTISPFTETLAAAVLGSLPLVIVFLVLQRQFVKGYGLAGFGGR